MRRVHRLIEKIDRAPDASPRYFREQFSTIPREAADVLVAQFRKMGSEARSLTIEWFRDCDVREALLPLMRYVYDTRKVSGRSRNPSLAMQAVMELSRPSDKARIHAFALDVADHSDPFVRGHCLSLLGRIGGPRANYIVEAGRRDSHSYPRQQAEDVLLERPTFERRLDPSWAAMTKEELRGEFYRCDSKELSFLVMHLRRRPEGVAVLEEVIQAGQGRTMYALHALQEFEEAQVRDVLRRFLRTEPPDKELELVLSTLLPLLNSGEIQPIEAQAIKSALTSSIRSLCCMGCRAARVVESSDFAPLLAELLKSEDDEVLAAAALALEGIVDEQCTGLFEPIVSGLRRVQLLRVTQHSGALAEAEATLLRILRGLCRQRGLRAVEEPRRLLESCFGSIRAGLEVPDIFTAAVSLLSEITPTDDASYSHWRDGDAAFLASTLGRIHPAHRGRVTRLLRRGSSPAFESRLCRIAEIALGRDDIENVEDFAGLLIPEVGCDLNRAIEEIFANASPSIGMSSDDAVSSLTESLSQPIEPLGDPKHCTWTRRLNDVLQHVPQEDIRRHRREFAPIVAPVSTTVVGVLFLASSVVAREPANTRLATENDNASAKDHGGEDFGKVLRKIGKKLLNSQVKDHFKYNSGTADGLDLGNEDVMMVEGDSAILEGGLELAGDALGALGECIASAF